MKCAGLACIVGRILAQQRELAEHLASADSIVDMGRRKTLLNEIAQTEREFQTFVAHYKIPVEARRTPPGKAKVC
jgi:hypothetical protein